MVDWDLGDATVDVTGVKSRLHRDGTRTPLTSGQRPSTYSGSPPTHLLLEANMSVGRT